MKFINKYMLLAIGFLGLAIGTLKPMHNPNFNWNDSILNNKNIGNAKDFNRTFKDFDYSRIFHLKEINFILEKTIEHLPSKGTSVISNLYGYVNTQFLLKNIDLKPHMKFLNKRTNDLLEKPHNKVLNVSSKYWYTGLIATLSIPLCWKEIISIPTACTIASVGLGIATSPLWPTQLNRAKGLKELFESKQEQTDIYKRY